MSREIIIGDIHGCYDELLALLEKVDLQPEDKVISVGDIVDRGPKSYEVYEFFRDRPNSVVLMGNHELKHLRGILSYSQEIVKVQFGERYPEFVEWLEDLPFYYENEHLIVVHAALEVGVPLEEQQNRVLAGTTSGDKYLQSIHPGKYWSDLYQGEKPVAFGHHVVGDEVKIIGGKVYGLDTGACHGGRLSALIVPGFEVVSVQVETDYWVQQIRDNQLKVLEQRPWMEMEWKKIAKDIARFRRKKEAAVQTYLDRLEGWRDQLLGAVPDVMHRLQEKQQTLMAEVGEENFNREAAKLPYRTLMFLVRKGALTEEKLMDSLDRPDKLLGLAEALGIKELPKAPPRA